MFIIKCPKCSTNTGFSLRELTYKGPFRCWKCRGTFIVTIENQELKSCKPISEEEFENIANESVSTGWGTGARAANEPRVNRNHYWEFGYRDTT